MRKMVKKKNKAVFVFTFLMILFPIGSLWVSELRIGEFQKSSNPREENEINIETANDYCDITSPSARDRLEAGKYYFITYEASTHGELYLYKGDKSIHFVDWFFKYGDDFVHWKVPTNIIDGNDYKIKAFKDETQREYLGESEPFEIYGGQGMIIYVNTPTHLSQWKRGSRMNITWEALGRVDYVNIHLYNKDEYVQTIATNVFDSGNYIWDISQKLENSAYYQIRVEVADTPEVKGYSEEFKIFGKDEIQILSPEPEINWKIGSHAITWNWYGGFDKVDIKLYRNGKYQMNLAQNTINDGYHPWNIPENFEEGDDYEIRIYSIFNTSIYDTSKFSIYNGFWDSLSIKRPNRNSHWRQNSTHQIRWNSDGQISYVDLILYKEKVMVNRIARRTKNDGSYNYTVPDHLLDDDSYSVSVFDSLDPKTLSNSPKFKISQEGDVYDDEEKTSSSFQFDIRYLPILLTGITAIPCSLILLWQHRKLKQD